MSDRELELVPNQDIKPEPFFKNYKEYQKFIDSFYEEVAPRLRELDEARAQSEEASRHHIIYS